jgi:putative solute:sodium symporter small subunit
MQNASNSMAVWATMTTPLLRLERHFGVRWLRRGMLAMLAGWLAYFAIISMWARVLNKVMVPFLDIPLGMFLAAQGTVVIFCAALVLLVKFSTATHATRRSSRLP